MSVSQEFLNRLDATHHTYGAKNLNYEQTEKLIRHLRENTFNNTERLNKLLQNEEGLSETNWMEAIRKYFWEQPGDYAEIIIKAGILEKPYHLKDKPIGEIKRLLKPITNASGYNFAVGKFNNNWSNSINYLRSSLNMSNGDYTQDVGRKVYEKLGYNRPSERGFYGSGYDPDHYFEPFYTEYVHYVDDLIWEKLNLDKKYAVEDSSPVWKPAAAYLGYGVLDDNINNMEIPNNGIALKKDKIYKEEGFLNKDEESLILKALEEFKNDTGGRYSFESTNAYRAIKYGRNAIEYGLGKSYNKIFIEIRHYDWDYNPEKIFDGVDVASSFIKASVGLPLSMLSAALKENTLTYPNRKFKDGLKDVAISAIGPSVNASSLLVNKKWSDKLIKLNHRANEFAQVTKTAEIFRDDTSFNGYTDVHIEILNNVRYSYRFYPDGSLYSNIKQNTAMPGGRSANLSNVPDLTIKSYASGLNNSNCISEYYY